ncbi:MAG TPA: hypothetical protein DEF42_10485 [Desulfosporosinus sp.]|nr:hypothetical protein [Desulfosporosinus sp.]
MNDMVIGVLSGIIATYLVKWLQYVFKGDQEITHSDTSRKYVDKVKRQFYFCFPSAILLIIVSSYIPAGSFLSVSVILSAGILFTLSLFAFMCAVAVIEELKNSNSDKKAD